MKENFLWYMRGDKLVREKILVTPSTLLDQILAWEATSAFGENTPVIIDEVVCMLEQTGIKADSRYYWIKEDQKPSIVVFPQMAMYTKTDILQ